MQLIVVVLAVIFIMTIVELWEAIADWTKRK